MNMYLSFDIGGTDIKYGILNKQGEIIYNNSTPTKAKEGGLSIIEQLVRVYKSLINDYEIIGISISAAGVIDPNTTKVLDATDSITNYIGLNYREEIQKRIGNVNISIENDVNCMALCEVTKGNAKDYKTVVAMTIGTGIGGAIVYNGNLLSGSAFSAGEWGKMIINNTKFESLAATSVLVKNAQRVYPSIKNGIDVFNLYDNKDEKIIPIVNDFFSNLSIGIANIMFTINPDVVVIGGGITGRGDKFLEELINHLKPRVSNFLFNNTKIKLAYFKNNSGMLGAFENYKKFFNK